IPFFCLFNLLGFLYRLNFFDFLRSFRLFYWYTYGFLCLNNLNLSNHRLYWQGLSFGGENLFYDTIDWRRPFGIDLLRADCNDGLFLFNTIPLVYKPFENGS